MHVHISFTITLHIHLSCHHRFYAMGHLSLLHITITTTHHHLRYHYHYHTSIIFSIIFSNLSFYISSIHHVLSIVYIIAMEFKIIFFFPERPRLLFSVSQFFSALRNSFLIFNPIIFTISISISLLFMIYHSALHSLNKSHSSSHLYSYIHVMTSLKCPFLTVHYSPLLLQPPPLPSPSLLHLIYSSSPILDSHISTTYTLLSLGSSGTTSGMLFLM